MFATVKEERRCGSQRKKRSALSRSKSYCQTTGVILALRRTEPHHDRQPALTTRLVAAWRCPLSKGLQGCMSDDTAANRWSVIFLGSEWGLYMTFIRHPTMEIRILAYWPAASPTYMSLSHPRTSLQPMASLCLAQPRLSGVIHVTKHWQRTHKINKSR